MYVSKKTLERCITDLQGTANHLLKIWFVLKEMGLQPGKSVVIDTQNSTEALTRLFSCGRADGAFFNPFAHTQRYATMKPDASRSIIQTTVQRWKTSDSVVTGSPTAYLELSDAGQGKVRVALGRIYPQGLGFGNDGFAMEEDSRVAIPILQMALWLFRHDDLSRYASDPHQPPTAHDLISAFRRELNIDEGEREALFVTSDLEMTFSTNPISDDELAAMCADAFAVKPTVQQVTETQRDYVRRIQMTTTIDASPKWTRTDPTEQLRQLVSAGEAAILLTGPPRTGKTRGIHEVVGRENPDRVTIQLHEGWNYENLIMGLVPSDIPGQFEWREGALLQAIREGKKHIVIEEINRTRISQALGEVFSLLEPAYRGRANAITLPDKSSFWIDEDVRFYFTMNNVDTSTEDVDDALMGRVASVDFPPRVEDLAALLRESGCDDATAAKIRELFVDIQSSYPLGHGYLAAYRPDEDFRLYYLWNIRPVLRNHFDSYEPEIVAQLDNRVDELFSAAP